MRLLDEEAGVPAQDVRPEQVLHGIEDFGMPDHLVDPGEQHVAAMAHLALDRASTPGFIILELAAKFGHFARAQRVDREVIAAFAITSDFIFAQQFWHGFPPIFFIFRCNARHAAVWSKVERRFSAVKKCRARLADYRIGLSLV